MSIGGSIPVVSRMRIWLDPHSPDTRAHALVTERVIQPFATIRLNNTFNGADELFGSYFDGGASEADLVANVSGFIVAEVDAGRPVAVIFPGGMQESLFTDAISRFTMPTQPTIASLLAGFIVGEIDTSHERARVGTGLAALAAALDLAGPQYRAAIVLQFVDDEFDGGSDSNDLFTAAMADATAAPMITAKAAELSYTNRQAFSWLLAKAIRTGASTLTAPMGIATRLRWFDAASANPAHIYLYGPPYDAPTSHQVYGATGSGTPIQLSSDLDDRNLDEPFLVGLEGPGVNGGVGQATAAETGALLEIARAAGVNDVMLFVSGTADLDALDGYIRRSVRDRTRLCYRIGPLFLLTGVAGATGDDTEGA